MRLTSVNYVGWASNLKLLQFWVERTQAQKYLECYGKKQSHQ